jgi:hypothetical protein
MLQILGIGVLVAGGLAVALAALVAAILFGPLLFWLAWNVLDFASAVGLPELGFWGIVLATLFLVVSWFGKIVIAGIVFLVDPSWFHGAAEVRWPEPTFRNFVASRYSPCWRRDLTRMRTNAPLAAKEANRSPAIFLWEG